MYGEEAMSGPVYIRRRCGTVAIAGNWFACLAEMAKYQSQ